MRHLGVTHGFSQTYHKKVVEDAQTTLQEIVKKKEHIKDILEVVFLDLYFCKLNLIFYLVY